MDRIPIFPAHKQNQMSTVSRPWRNATSANWNSQKVQHTKVDSWRSYRDDATNLQSTTNPSSGLNATAPSFHPTQHGSYYKPYESLRTSDGAKERILVEQAQNETPKDFAPDAVTGSASRYPVRTIRVQADRPLPSIERADLHDRYSGNGPNQAQQGFHTGRSRRSTPQQRRTPRATASPAPPASTEKYRAQALREPATLTQAQKLLVILDLNGTLLYRNKQGNKRKAYMRPGVTPLLDYLFSNHVVMVYTSAMPDTAMDMVSQFIHPLQREKLAAIWARDKLDLSDEQYRSKVQVYKKLDKVWGNKQIQATAGIGKKWDQSNTVLIDDSKLKALAQPHNLLQVIEYTKEDDPNKAEEKQAKNKRLKTQIDILKQLELKLETLRYQEDVSRLIRKWQAGEIPVPKLPGQEVSVEENVDQSLVHRQDGMEAAKRKGTVRARQLPTPISIEDGDTAEYPVEISSDEENGGAALSGASLSTRTRTQVPTSSSRGMEIPGLGMLSEEEEVAHSADDQTRESSIDEAVFQELLGKGKK